MFGLTIAVIIATMTTIVTPAMAPARIRHHRPARHQHRTANKSFGNRDTLPKDIHIVPGLEWQYHHHNYPKNRAEDRPQNAIRQPPANDGLSNNTNNNSDAAIDEMAQSKTEQHWIAE